MCSRYLVFQVGQRIVTALKQSGGLFQPLFGMYSKRPHLSMWSFVFALLIFQVGQRIVLPSVSIRRTFTGRKKPRLFSRGFVFALLTSQVGQCIVTALKQSGGLFQPLFGKSIKQKTTSFDVVFCVRVTYFPGRPTYRPAVRKYPADIYRQKKAPTFQSRLCVRVTYFPRQSPAKYRQRT